MNVNRPRFASASAGAGPRSGTADDHNVSEWLVRPVSIADSQ
jgi:hypothetical protein